MRGAPGEAVGLEGESGREDDKAQASARPSTQVITDCVAGVTGVSGDR